MHLTGQQSVNKRDKKQLTIENFKAMLDNALKNIKEREDEFSKLDAVIGDGDHGQAIVTAMSAIVATATPYNMLPVLSCVVNYRLLSPSGYPKGAGFLSPMAISHHKHQNRSTFSLISRKYRQRAFRQRLCSVPRAVRYLLYAGPCRSLRQTVFHL